MRHVLAVVLAIVLGMAGCDSSAPPSPRPVPGQVLDLNRATTAQLEALPGIGIKHARSIIASRNARGGRFTRLEDLIQIDGIGEKTVEAIRPYVVVGP